MLEDYHAVQSIPIHGLIERLVQMMPPSMQVIVLSRVDPPWPLGHWRAQGWLGGWIAALRLVQLSVRASPRPEEPARALSGTDHLMVDYLMAEVLALQPREILQASPSWL